MSVSNRIDASILGELYLEEMPLWRVGLCVVRTDGEEVVVEGESGHEVERFEPPKVPSALRAGPEMVYDLDEATERVNQAIAAEHRRL